MEQRSQREIRVGSIERLFRDAGLKAERIATEFEQGEAGWQVWDSEGRGPLGVIIAGQWLDHETHDPTSDLAGALRDIAQRLQQDRLEDWWVYDKRLPDSAYPVGGFVRRSRE